VRVSTIAPPHQNPAARNRPRRPSFKPKVNFANGFAAENLRTIADAVDGSRTTSGSTVRANPLKTNGETDADGADANLASHSVLERTRLTARLMVAQGVAVFFDGGARESHEFEQSCESNAPGSREGHRLTRVRHNAFTPVGNQHRDLRARFAGGDAPGSKHTDLSIE
jgi:hypothetical protein